MEMIEIDGSQGGGQLLRSALSLSLCTGIGFRMDDIRGKRPRPGLMRQHLTAVQAAAEVGAAHVDGATLGATRLMFRPGVPRAGHYTFNTGGAGSTMLVLQTVLPALWRCDAPSRVDLRGGTHNPMAPSADFIADCYLPALRRMGIAATLDLAVPGFHPAGGGEVAVEVQPCAAVHEVAVERRGALQSIRADVLLSGLSDTIGRRELSELVWSLGIDPDPSQVRHVRPALGPGNTVQVTVRHEEHVEVFTLHGERGLSAERVAGRLAGQVQAYLEGDACVAEHLADQLLLPMALAGGGRFTTATISDHLSSNARLIEKFLPVEIDWQEVDGHWRVIVAS